MTDYERLAQIRDRHRQDVTSRWHSDIAFLLDCLDAANAENERLRAALTAFAQRGIHADCNPTLGGRLGDGTQAGRWYDYLTDADRTVRNIARRALTIDAESAEAVRRALNDDGQEERA